jgi:pimeloyl-ACP methyl ester carboxylesterase
MAVVTPLRKASGLPMVQSFLSDGVRIAFIDVAPEAPDRGEPILLIHGFASNHRINWVNPRWVETLSKAGRRVIAFDNRGHGESEKLYDPEAYRSEAMARDAANLIDHLEIERADVMGYSMGARIASFLALADPARVRALILGGLGDRLVQGVGLPLGIAEAMEAPSLNALSDPMQRTFRAFADQTKSDRAALAACIRGSRQTLDEAEVRAIACPTLVAVGTRDEVAGDPHRLAAMFPRGEALEIPGRDHNLAVGDKVYKAGVLAFLDRASGAAPGRS